MTQTMKHFALFCSLAAALAFAPATATALTDPPERTSVPLEEETPASRAESERDSPAFGATAVGVATEVDIQRRFNDVRREVLNFQMRSVTWWLTAAATFLTLLSVAAVFLGYVGFNRFQQIEQEARKDVEEIKGYRKQAEEQADDMQRLTSQDVDNPETAEAARETMAAVLGNPEAGLLDRAVAEAFALQSERKITEAIEKWRSIANIAEGTDNDQAARAWFSVGYLIHDGSADGDTGKAVDAYDRAIALKPDLAEAYASRGQAKRALGRQEDAIFDYDQAIARKPDLAEAYRNRGDAKQDLDRHEDAIADFDQALRLDPEDSDAYYSRGNARQLLGRYEEAVADYDEALRLKPDVAETHHNRGHAKRTLGRYQDAILDYDRAIELQPDLVLARVNRGFAKAVSGGIEEARADFDTALNLAQQAGNEGLKADIERRIQELPDLAQR